MGIVMGADLEGSAGLGGRIEGVTEGLTGVGLMGVRAGVGMGIVVGGVGVVVGGVGKGRVGLTVGGTAKGEI